VNKIESINDFFDVIAPSTFSESRGRWVFRGHAISGWDLKPSISRSKKTSKTIRGHEQSMLEAFEREAHIYKRADCENEWEWLALAQHHGLPTRMLDWTHNPLVSLYFAVSSEKNEEGEIFTLHSKKKAGRKTLSKSPFDLEKPVKYYPKIVSERLRAQEGLFIVFNDPETCLFECKQGNWVIERFSIPAKSKQGLQYDLFRLGVHESALFPDIDGLARRISWQHGITPPRAKQVQRTTL
jgi:hypothetical protein